MGKVEEVARAIYEARNGPRCNPWSWQPKSHQEPYLADAKAAIKAMREPSIAMRHVATFQAAEIDWPAMIDAALSEDKEQG